MAGTTALNTDTDNSVQEIVDVAIHELGGLASLTQHHQLGILPSVVEASYILYLHEEQGVSIDEIAQQLDISRGVVESVLKSPFTNAFPRLKQAGGEYEEFDIHTEPEWSGMPETGRQEPEYLAGAVAKFAYSVVLRRKGQGGM